MTEDEAVEVAKYVKDLWGLKREDVWTAFYAAAITDIPTQQDALRALRDLFTRLRHPPTPAELIGAAGAVEALPEPERQWRAVTMGRYAALTNTARAVLATMGGFEAIPGDWEKRRWFERDFVEKYRTEQAHAAIEERSHSLPPADHLTLDLRLDD